jgi:hypothetical protein
MVVVLIRLQSTLPDDEVSRRTLERFPAFATVPGLVQKYVARGASDGEFVGVLVFASAEAAAAFRGSELAGTTATAYAVSEPPRVEILPVLHTLHDEALTEMR